MKAFRILFVSSFLALTSASAQEFGPALESREPLPEAEPFATVAPIDAKARVDADAVYANCGNVEPNGSTYQVLKSVDKRCLYAAKIVETN